MNVPSYADRLRIESRLAQGLPLETSQATLDLIGALLALAPEAVSDDRTAA